MDPNPTAALGRVRSVAEKHAPGADADAGLQRKLASPHVGVLVVPEHAIHRPLWLQGLPT